MPNMSPFNGNFVNSAGEVQNLDGAAGAENGMSPFSGDFIASDGSVMNIDALMGGGGGSGGMSRVFHDGTLTGNGTSEEPLGVAPAWVFVDEMPDAEDALEGVFYFTLEP
jgi:hypothetical protein